MAKPATPEPASALEAIDAALGLTDDEKAEIPDGTTDDEQLTSGEDVPGDDEGSADDDEDSQEDGAEDEDGEEAEADDEEEGDSEFNADGTRKEPKADAKKLDPVNDPIPKDLKPATNERMRALVKIAKDRDTELTQVRGDFDTIINGIKASGSTPEQYGEAISWLSLFNSSEPASRMKAYELVNEVADRLAMLLNVDRAVSDPLKDFPDLKADVASGKVSAQYARELARNRGATAFSQTLQSGQRQQQQTQQQAQQEDTDARAALNAIAADLEKNDPLYARKREELVPILKPIFAQIPKKQWPAAFKQAYDNHRVKPLGNSINKAKTKSQPMRGNKQPAGGQTRQAGSMMEAINGALAGLTK